MNETRHKILRSVKKKKEEWSYMRHACTTGCGGASKMKQSVATRTDVFSTAVSFAPQRTYLKICNLLADVGQRALNVHLGLKEPVRDEKLLQCLSQWCISINELTGTWIIAVYAVELHHNI